MITKDRKDAGRARTAAGEPGPGARGPATCILPDRHSYVGSINTRWMVKNTSIVVLL